jgi:hypothetical protein
MGQQSSNQRAPSAVVDNIELVTFGRFFRTLRLRNEGYEFIDQPERSLQQLRDQRVNADLFAFTQRLSEPSLKYPYYSESDSYAVLSVSTYDHWWKKQINDKTRNMVRKAEKKGLVIRVAEFNDELVAGIQGIHDEHPLRQGKPFKHYGKPFEIVKRDHATFLDRSTFIGAYLGHELVGMIKLVHQGAWASLMQIISKISHREKAPTNALMAKAIAVCAERGIPELQYGQWSRRGIGEFKLHHGFERKEIPRYFVPLNAKGRFMLRCKLHRSAVSMLPTRVESLIWDVRSKWYYFKFRNHQLKGQ